MAPTVQRATRKAEGQMSNTDSTELDHSSEDLITKLLVGFANDLERLNNDVLFIHDYVSKRRKMFDQHTKSVEQRARIEALESLEEWFQQYGYEMHVSHVCPTDSTSCAELHGRTQKMNQVHKEVRERLTTLKAQHTQEGGK